MREGAVKVAVHRLRRGFADLVRDEIAQTLTTPDEIDDEIQYLFTVFG
jgi:RNA polymerase sigma-70 factor (ECF subfamily)